MRFVWLASPHARPVELGEVLARLREIDSGTVPQEPARSEEALRERIVSALGIDFLLEGLPDRTLEVRRLSRTEHPDHVEHELELRDPWVGSFGALLLEPTTPGPHPAVVAVHGHGDTMEVYRDDYHGAEHAPRGYVTLILDMRAMGSGPAGLLEHRITPGLYPVSEQLHDRAASPVPTLEVPYRYTNGMQEIFDFFDLHTATP